MKKTLVPAAALAVSLMTVSVGWAQAQEPSDCAAAVTALSSADAAHKAAVDADKAAAAARDADRALNQAEKKLDDAQKAHDVAQADVTTKQAELDRLNEPGTNDGKVGTPAQIKNAEIALDEARNTVKDRKASVDAAREVRNDARVDADETDAKALQDKANETDAAALQNALEEARKDFDRLCGGVTTTPPADADPADVDCDEVGASEAQRILDADRSDPNNLDQDKDGIACEIDEILPDPDDDNGVTVNNDVAVPSGGVPTGGGPAWAFQ